MFQMTAIYMKLKRSEFDLSFRLLYIIVPKQLNEIDEDGVELLPEHSQSTTFNQSGLNARFETKYWYKFSFNKI